MPTPDAPANTTTNLTLGQAAKVCSIVMLFLTSQTVYTAYTNSWNWSNFMDSSTLSHVAASMGQATLLGGLGALPRTVQVLVIFWAQPSLWSMIISILQGIPQLVASVGRRIGSFFSRHKKETSAN